MMTLLWAGRPRSRGSFLEEVRNLRTDIVVISETRCSFRLLGDGKTPETREPWFSVWVITTELPTLAQTDLLSHLMSTEYNWVP
jgi:hypothetical protein